jgi:hypothetical protein
MSKGLSASAFCFAVLAGWFLSDAEASERPLIFVGLTMNGPQTHHSKNSLADMLTRQLLTHLQMMGESVIVPGSRELLQPCPRECQISLAQQKHGDILRVEIAQDGASDFDISYSLWRFDTIADRPLTDYPIEQQTSCDQCSASQLSEKLNAQAGMLIESTASVTKGPLPAIEPSRRLPSPVVPLPLLPSPGGVRGAGGVAPEPNVTSPATQPGMPGTTGEQIALSASGGLDSHTLEPRGHFTDEAGRSQGQRIAAGVFGVLASVSLGAAIALQVMDSRLNGQPISGNAGRVWDLTNSYAIGYGAAAGLGLISILTIAIPSHSKPALKKSLLAAANWR